MSIARFPDALQRTIADSYAARVNHMPDSYSRYQSRLLNFILQQSILWTDRAAQAVRHLQVATVWGIQALLYPIYVAVEATRRQLGSTSASEERQFAPTTDTPIQLVLEDIQRGKLNESPEPSMPKFAGESGKFPHPNAAANWIKSWVNRIGAIVRVGNPSSGEIAVSQPAAIDVSQRQICGVASLIPEKKLVLVGSENRILDVLSSPQQQELERRIFIEIGNYWMAKQNPQPQGKLNRLVEWVQKSPIARSVNLFPERNPQESNCPTALQPSISPVNPTQSVTIDRWHTLVRSAQTSLTETQQFVTEKARSVRFPKLADPWQSSSSNFPPKSTAKTVNGSATPTDRPALPTALEIPDLYYHKVGKVVKSASESLRAKIELAADRFAQIADPWLSPLEDTEKDTDRLIEPIETLTRLPSSVSLERPIAQLQAWAQESRNWLAEWGIPGLEPRTEVALETPSIAPVSSQKLEEFANPFVWESDIATLPPPSPGNWIDTEATSVEYIKHPLERILEWLDRIAFWLEERIVQLWQSLQRWWQQRHHFPK
ncbi:MAG TPA: hypothetical protein IGS17_13345 [Oscillatoriales cyanobacterium M59_W2019_021]|nr:hypothetical protein [Oscillatoriales cyanobacterium M59_W2019_021]